MNEFRSVDFASMRKKYELEGSPRPFSILKLLQQKQKNLYFNQTILAQSQQQSLKETKHKRTFRQSPETQVLKNCFRVQQMSINPSSPKNKLIFTIKEKTPKISANINRRFVHLKTEGNEPEPGPTISKFRSEYEINHLYGEDEGQYQQFQIKHESNFDQMRPLYSTQLNPSSFAKTPSNIIQQKTSHVNDSEPIKNILHPKISLSNWTVDSRNSQFSIDALQRPKSKEQRKFLDKEIDKFLGKISKSKSVRTVMVGK